MLTHLSIRAVIIASSLAAAGCGSTTDPSPTYVDYVVSVEGERFVVRLTDPETLRLAEENRLGRSNAFPAGPLRRGDGGFNGPWTWHLDPGETRFVEAAIEICDGRPSYVEANQADFPTYCPWGARVVGRR